MHWFLWFLGINTTLTILLLLLITWFPKYLVIAYNRSLMLKYGIKRKFLQITPTLSLAYMDRGSTSSATQTLLLVHGFSSSKENFLPLIKHLPRRIRVIAVDLPGHGESGMKEKEEFGIRSFVQHIKEFVDVLGISKSKFHLMGASMGGHISGMYAITHPEDVISVTLMCPHGIKNEHEEALFEKAQRQNKFVLLPDTLESFRDMFNMLCHKEIKIPDFIMRGALQIRMAKAEIYTRVGYSLRDKESLYLLERNLGRLTTPLFLLWGREDKILHVDSVEVIKANIPSPAKKVVIIEEAGHTLVLEQPRKCANLIVEFLNTFSPKA